MFAASLESYKSYPASKEVAVYSGVVSEKQRASCHVSTSDIKMMDFSFFFFHSFYHLWYCFHKGTWVLIQYLDLRQLEWIAQIPAYLHTCGQSRSQGKIQSRLPLSSRHGDQNFSPWEPSAALCPRGPRELCCVSPHASSCHHEPLQSLEAASLSSDTHDYGNVSHEALRSAPQPCLGVSWMVSCTVHASI